MIVLDTHVWVWWVHGAPQFPESLSEVIESNEATGLGVSAISLWEVAKLVELGRLELPRSLEDWFAAALNYPGIVLLPLTPQIAIESTRLPGEFHQDPAVQLITATARVHDCPLASLDEKIIRYPHVETPT